MKHLRAALRAVRSFPFDDLLALIGAGLVAYGASLYSGPLGPIVLGLAIVLYAGMGGQPPERPRRVR